MKIVSLVSRSPDHLVNVVNQVFVVHRDHVVHLDYLETWACPAYLYVTVKLSVVIALFSHKININEDYFIILFGYCRVVRVSGQSTVSG